MNTVYNEERLRRLVSNLNTLTGVPANILDAQGRDVHKFSGHPAFCALLNADPEGHRRCVECDARKVAGYESNGGFQFYRCHVGICEALMPLYKKEGPLAWLVFGCFLDDSPIEEQWQNTQALLDWYTGDREELRLAFFLLRRLTARQQCAYAETLEALAAYIRLEGLVSASELSDAQRLKLCLDRHYMEKISLASLSAELHIGRTKLCALAKELSGGHTLSWLIAQRRIDEAKRLLAQSSLPVSAVAEAVGISDYNYFTKVFRAVTGTTPSRFRKAARRVGESGEWIVESEE